MSTLNINNDYIHLNSASSDKVVVEGNLGIGTSSPATNLHIATTGGSTLTIQNTTNSGNASLKFRDEGSIDQYSIYYALSSNRAYNLVNGNGVTIYSSQTSSEIARFGLDTGYNNSYFNGSVGIGTSSPERQLSLYSNNTETTPRLLIEQDGTGDAVMAFSLTGGQGWSMGIDNSLGDSFMIHDSSGGVDSSSQFTINGSGNVGIGTTSPGGKLHITQGGSSMTQVLIGNTGTGGARTYYDASNGDFAGNDYMSIGQDDDLSGVIDMAALAGSFHIKTGGSNRFTVNQAGNVGIGTTSPATPLHVLGGTAGTGGWNKTATLAATYPGLIFNSNGTKWGGMAYDYSAAMRFWVNASNDDIFAGTAAMSILNNGNVGIGTTSPDSVLDIKASGDGQIFTVKNSSGNNILRLYNDDDDGGTFRLLDSGGNIQVQFSSEGSGATFNYILSSNVGIGTTSPGAKLDVAGQIITSDSVRFTSNVSTPTGNSVFRPASNTLAFGTSSVERMRITSSGDVGIGTTSPSAALHVQKDVSGGFAGYLYNTQSTGGFGLSVRGGNSSSEDALRVQNVGGTYLLNVKGDGNVGIGTTAPAALLTVSNTVDNGAAVRVQRTNTLSGSYTELGTVGGSGRIESFNGNLTVGADASNTDSSSVIQFKVDNSEKARITSDGNVGVGTISPSYPLHVNGGALNFIAEFQSTDDKASILIQDDDTLNYIHSQDGYLSLGGQNALNNANLNINSSTGNVGIGTTSPNERLDVAGNIQLNGNYLKLNEGTNAESRIVSSANYLEIIGNGPSAASGARMWLGKGDTVDTGFYVNGGQLFFRGLDSSTKMYINGGSGNVGIGTTSPSNLLHIVASGNNASALIVQDAARRLQLGRDMIEAKSIDGSTVQNLYIQPNGNTALATTSGNVGVGTTGPTHKLHVVGNVKLEGTTYLAYPQVQDDGRLRFGDGNDYSIGYNSADDTLRIAGGNSLTTTPRITLNSSGNVGIGTTSPSSKLHINGTFKSIGIQDSSTSQAIFINGNAEVGIGTTSPTTKLHVNGTSRVVKSKIDITPTSDTIALDVRGTGTPNDYFTVSNATGGANDVFLPIFFYKAATYGYNGGTNRYPSGVYGGGFVAAVDDTSYPSAAGAGAAMHFNARTYANNGPLTNRYLFSWGSWLTTHMAMTAGGNLLIGKTTDSGEELQVNGDADVSGDINADGDFYHNGTQGYTGNVTIQQPSPNPPITLEINGGIITNVT
jgi:hypothetical protein